MLWVGCLVSIVPSVGSFYGVCLMVRFVLVTSCSICALWRLIVCDLFSGWMLIVAWVVWVLVVWFGVAIAVVWSLVSCLVVWLMWPVVCVRCLVGSSFDCIVVTIVFCTCCICSLVKFGLRYRKFMLVCRVSIVVVGILRSLLVFFMFSALLISSLLNFRFFRSRWVAVVLNVVGRSGCRVVSIMCDVIMVRVLVAMFVAKGTSSRSRSIFIGWSIVGSVRWESMLVLL